MLIGRERGARGGSDEQRDRMNLWDSSAKTSERLTELLLRLDRKDHLVAQALAGVKNTATHPQATFLGTSNPERLDDSVRDARGNEAGESPSTTAKQYVPWLPAGSICLKTSKESFRGAP